MKVEYIAFDGRRFDDEDKCRQYELSEVIKGCVTLLDSDGSRIDISDDIDPDTIEYVVIHRKHEEVCRYLRSLQLSGFDEKGYAFMRNSVFGRFLDVEKLIERAQERYDNLVDIFNKIQRGIG